MVIAPRRYELIVLVSGSTMIALKLRVLAGHSLRAGQARSAFDPKRTVAPAMFQNRKLNGGRVFAIIPRRQFGRVAQAEPVPLKYRAFISYGHADVTWARWLHRAIETFRIDKDLASREKIARTEGGVHVSQRSYSRIRGGAVGRFIVRLRTSGFISG